MTVKRDLRRTLRKLVCCRRGTAEIVGSIMFLLIMMFFFTNVFLWHDRATREMDGVVSDKMNSPVSIQVVNENVTKTGGVLHLNVTNNGGVSVQLSRLWIINNGGAESHDWVDRTEWVTAGATVLIPIDNSHITFGMQYTFKIVTTRGNMASCSCKPYE